MGRAFPIFLCNYHSTASVEPQNRSSYTSLPLTRLQETGGYKGKHGSPGNFQMHCFPWPTPPPTSSFRRKTEAKRTSSSLLAQEKILERDKTNRQQCPRQASGSVAPGLQVKVSWPSRHLPVPLPFCHLLLKQKGVFCVLPVGPSAPVCNPWTRKEEKKK